MESNSTCRFACEVGAYHDGQLDAARREAFAAHVDGCAACRGELAQLAGLRKFLASGPRARLSQIDIFRLQSNVLRRAQGNVLRLARVLSAVAACILVAGSVQLVRSNVATVPAVAPNPPWVEATLPAGDLRGTGTPAAQWYLADATHGSEEIP